MKRRAAARWLCFAMLLRAGAPSATAAPFDYADESEVAPLDCWPMPDGCPSRSGACRTTVPRGPLERAWTYEPKKGEITGEALVWKHLVVVPFADGFEVLDLVTGGVLASKRNIAKNTTTVPVMGPGFILARTAPDRLEAFSIDLGTKASKSIWSWKCPIGDITSNPIVWERDIYAFSGATAYRLRVGRPEPIWESKGREPESVSADAPYEHRRVPEPAGQPSIVGGRMFIVTERPVRVEGGRTSIWVELTQIETGTGYRFKPSFLSTSAQSRDGGYRGSGFITGRARAELFVLTNGGFLTAKDTDTTTALLPTDDSPPGDIRLLSLRGPPVRWKDRWVLLDVDEHKQPYLGITVDPKSESPSRKAKKEPADKGPNLARDVLSDATHSQHILAAGVPATSAGNAILVGPVVFDPDTRDVLHELPARAAFRTVPARGTILVVEGDEVGHGTRLVAFRAKRAPAGAATVVFRPTPPAGAPTDAAIVSPSLTVVRRDGVVRTGAVAFVPGADTISFPPPSPKPGVRPPPALPDERWPLVDVALITDSGRHVLHAGDPDDAIAAMTRAAEAMIAREWFAFASEAWKKGAIARARVALSLAEAYGTPDADVWRSLVEIDAAEKRARKPTSSDEKALDAKEAAVRTKSAGTVWSWSEGIPADAPPVLVARLARLALDADPSTTGPSEWVRAHVPPGIETGASFATRDWLTFLDALRTTPVHLVDVPPVQKNLTNSQRHLGAARATWRKDVVAFECRRAVVITPVVSPGRIARCLATAELVCRALESIFEEYRRKRAETDPLVMYLYETKEEYLERSGGTGTLEWTLGHYSPSDGASRLFVPADDAEFASVAATFAHELTHHWMDLCCPAFSDAERVQGQGNRPGYWIEEGFAQFIEEGRADLGTGRYELESATAESVDIVANVGVQQIVPWSLLFEMNSAGFRRLDATKPQIDVPMRWKLGFRRRLTDMNLFYAQAGAATRYLYFAEGGKHRKALLEFVATFHANRAAADTLSKALGMSYLDLGAKVTAWCQELQRTGTK